MTDEEFSAEMTAMPPVFHTPWEPTPEQWGKNRHWADYACWESWIESKIEASLIDDLQIEWEAMDTPLRTVFYGAMIDACKFTAENPTQPAAAAGEGR